MCLQRCGCSSELPVWCLGTRSMEDAVVSAAKRIMSHGTR